MGRGRPFLIIFSLASIGWFIMQNVSQQTTTIPSIMQYVSQQTTTIPSSPAINSDKVSDEKSSRESENNTIGSMQSDDNNINQMDDETKAICQRAWAIDSMGTTAEQVSYIKQNGPLSSQMYQDATIISSLGEQILRGGGVYADVAAAHPRILSNTFVLEKCYNWRGVCVEGDPLRVGLLKDQRSCAVVDTCASERDGEEVDFFITTNEGDTLSNGIRGVGGRTGKSIKLKCKTLASVFREKNITHVDFMSLDVESAEHLVLSGIDWSRVNIELIVIEVNKHTIRKEGDTMKKSADRIVSILEAHDFIPVLELFPYGKKTMPIDDCTSVLLGQSVRSAFQPERKDNFGLGVWRRQDVLFVRKGGQHEKKVVDWVNSTCGNSIA